MNLSVVLLLSLLFLLSSASETVAAQLSGKILDQSDNPIIGAVVSAKEGTNEAKIGSSETDYNGNYSLLLPDGTYTLTVSYVTEEGKQEQSFNDQQVAGTIQKDLILASKTNAPVPSTDARVPIPLIGGVSIVVILTVIFWLFHKMRKK